AGRDIVHHHASCRGGQAAVGGNGHGAIVRADPAAYHVAGLDDLVEHVARAGDGNGEADAFGADGLADQRGVDANQVAVGVDQRAAGVAEVDRGVRLDEVLQAGQ